MTKNDKNFTVETDPDPQRGLSITLYSKALKHAFVIQKATRTRGKYIIKKIR
jgi:hypothetical protein